MSRELKLEMTPELIRLALFAVGAAIILLIWNILTGSIREMAYQPVYGENAAVVVAAISPKTLALPMVESAIHDDALIADSADDDDMKIEGAFSAPKVEEPKTEEAPPAISLAQQLFMIYQPAIQGVGAGGAFIKDQFWSIGESMTVMPIKASSGEIVYPKIASIGRSEVVLVIDGERLSLQLEGMQ